MERTLLKRILKGLIGATVFNMLIQLWIFIELSYSLQWIFYVFITVCMIITVVFTKEQNIKTCLSTLVVFWIVCILIWILVEFIKSEFKINSRIYEFELWAGDGFAMVAIYIYSIIAVIIGSIIAIITSWWCQKRHCSQ